MSRLVTPGWGLVIQSHDARLSDSNGATITPGNNTYGSYATVLAGASVTDDVYAIRVFVHGIGVSATAKDAILTIGVDTTGGTTPNVTLLPDLIVSNAGATSAGSRGVTYWFPIKVTAGSTIMAKVSTNNATVGTAQVSVTLFCRPTRKFRSGTFCRAFGVTAAGSNGTAVTAGTTSEGSYTQIGSALAEPLWFFNAGIGQNAGGMAAVQIALDLAIGSSTSVNRAVIVENTIEETAAEMRGADYRGEHCNGAVGDLLFARLQNSGTATAFSVAAYGIGG